MLVPSRCRHSASLRRSGRRAPTLDAFVPDPAFAAGTGRLLRWGTARVPFESPDEIRTRLERGVPGGRELVAFVDGQLVGNPTLERLVGRRSHIGRVGMGAHDAWVGRGIGTAPIAALVDIADRWLDLRRLELDVNVDNEPAQALYQRFGFAVEGRHSGHVFRDGSYVTGSRWRGSTGYDDGPRRRARSQRNRGRGRPAIKPDADDPSCTPPMRS